MIIFILYSDGTRESSIVTKMFLVEDIGFDGSDDGDGDVDGQESSRRSTMQVCMRYIILTNNGI